MDPFITALIDQNVTSCEFYATATEFGIHENEYVLDVYNALLTREVPRVSPTTEWLTEEADFLLARLPDTTDAPSSSDLDVEAPTPSPGAAFEPWTSKDVQDALDAEDNATTAYLCLKDDRYVHVKHFFYRK